MLIAFLTRCLKLQLTCRFNFQTPLANRFNRSKNLRAAFIFQHVLSFSRQGHSAWRRCWRRTRKSISDVIVNFITNLTYSPTASHTTNSTRRRFLLGLDFWSPTRWVLEAGAMLVMWRVLSGMHLYWGCLFREAMIRKGLKYLLFKLRFMWNFAMNCISWNFCDC